VGELSLIKKFRAGAPTHPWITVGPGQDCAVLNWPVDRDQAFKIDQVSEGTHFVLSGAGAATPYQVGWKAVAKACSDIAAAGGWPVAAMVAVNLRKGSDEKVALELYEGICACCRRFNFGLAGGDICVSENGLNVTVSLLGECAKNSAWTRAGAKPGDALLVTGALGGSLKSGRHLNLVPRLEQAKKIRELAQGGVHACIDVTDGLSRDLHHLCDESRCGAVVNTERVPLSEQAGSEDERLRGALSDGEDFELLLAVDPAAAEELLKKWNDAVALKKIGEILPEKDGRWLQAADGKRRALADVGYEHRA
jgi:thiamine-monophosphate kinase